MALSDNAIGFFLEVEDVSLTRTLRSATKSYDEYTSALDKYNKQAFDSASRGLGQIAKLVKAVEELPMAAARSMKKASGTIEKQLKPISQKINLTITATSATKLKKVVGQAVSDAMTGANIRLSASLPQRRLGLFQQGVGLRAQYADLPQPPDMRGKIKPLRKYAKGGVVEGPAGIDKVLALLTKDEMVLPADISKDLQKAAGGRLKTSGGKFASSKELGTLVSEVTNLANALDKMKGGLEEGVGTEQEMEAYQKGVEGLAKKVGMLAEAQNDLSFVTKVRLSPSILQATKRLEDFQEEGVETGNVFEKLLGRVIGPARFLAIAKGIESMQDGFNSLTSAGSAFGTGDELTGAIENINEMNKDLGLSRDKLRVVKVEAAQTALALEGISTPELTAAMLAASQQGIRLSDGLIEIASSAALAQRGMDLAAGEVSDFGFTLRSDLAIGQQGFDSILASIGELSNDTNKFNVDAADLFAQTQNNVSTLHNTLAALPSDQAQAMVTNFNRLGAALETNFIAADGLRDVLARAIESGGTDMEAMSTATLLTGQSYKELHDTMVRGDLENLLAGVGDRLGSINPQQLAATARIVGISAKELGNLSKNADSLHDTLLRTETVVVANADAQRVMQERAKATKSWFELLKESVIDNISAFDHWGINGMEMIDVMKEFNLTALASVAILGKGMVGSFGKAGVSAAKFGMQMLQTDVSVKSAKDGLSAVGGKVGKLRGGFAKMFPTIAKGLGSLTKGLTGLVKFIGPLGLLAAAAGVATIAVIDHHQESIRREGEALGLQAKLAHEDPTRLKKNIERVQTQIDIDEAAGKVANPTAIQQLARYNAELTELEAHLKAKFNPRAQSSEIDLASLTSVGSDLVAPVTAAEMAAIMPSPASTEKQERLMEQMVMIMEEQLRIARQGTTPANPSPTIQGPSLGVSALGQQVAGGNL